MRDRFCPVLEPDFLCCKPPFSFYHLIEKYWPSTEANRTLHRVFSLMRKMSARGLVVEDLARKGELDREAAAVEVRCGGPVEFQAWRFSFFGCALTRDYLPYASDEDYLGYAVFISMKLPNGAYRRYVYESVISEPAFHTDSTAPFGNALPAHYTHCIRRYSAWVAGHRFTVSGSFFSQQNGLTHVCGQAALRWLLNNLPERAEEIVSYEGINQDLGIDHKMRRVGQYGEETEVKGLDFVDFLKVVGAHEYKYILARYQDPAGTPQPYWRFIYSIIESGYPVLVFFTASNVTHVICAIGHTLNSDMWDSEAKLAYSGAPRAKYLSSDSWVDHFIIHDDNYGMYFSMPIKALSPAAKQIEPFQVTGALGIVPAKIDLGPLEAELFASIVLKPVYQGPLEDCYWLQALRQEEAAFGKWVVLRTLLASKAAYQEHLRNMEDVEGNALTKREIKKIIHEKIPEHFWLTEITLTDIYTANKRKLGEILFDLSEPGTTSADDAVSFTRKVFEACIAVRLPGNIIIPKVGPKQISLTLYATNLVGHVPLLRTRCPAPSFEW